MRIDIDKIKSIGDWHNCFCESSPSMSTIRGGITALLRYCFSDPSHYADNKDILGCLKYSPDKNAVGNLQILAKGAKDPADTNNVPGIFVSLGDGVSYQFDALSDIHTSSINYSKQTVDTLGTAQVTIKCSAEDADVSCAMCDTCMMFMMGTKPKVMKAWKGWLRDYRVIRQTEPALQSLSGGDSTYKWYDSTLVIQLIYHYSVDTVHESKLLKGFTIESDTKG